MIKIFFRGLLTILLALILVGTALSIGFMASAFAYSLVNPAAFVYIWQIRINGVISWLAIIMYIGYIE